jgi:metal-responsive CopG/Arc/MetJ family transcriptional regulator
MSTQLAIRLPDDLLRDLDWVVHRLNYDSRTEAMRDALVKLIDQERRRQIDEQYIEAYTRMPQTEEEMADIPFQSWDLDGDDDWSDLS